MIEKFTYGGMILILLGVYPILGNGYWTFFKVYNLLG